MDKEGFEKLKAVIETGSGKEDIMGVTFPKELKETETTDFVDIYATYPAAVLDTLNKAGMLHNDSSYQHSEINPLLKRRAITPNEGNPIFPFARFIMTFEDVWQPEESNF